MNLKYITLTVVVFFSLLSSTINLAQEKPNLRVLTGQFKLVGDLTWKNYFIKYSSGDGRCTGFLSSETDTLKLPVNYIVDCFPANVTITATPQVPSLAQGFIIHINKMEKDKDYACQGKIYMDRQGDKYMVTGDDLGPDCSVTRGINN